MRLYLQQPVRLSIVIITRPILADIVKQVHPVMRYRALTVDDAIAVLEFTELYVIFRNAFVFLYVICKIILLSLSAVGTDGI